eukprot:scaffold111285_cov69-Phaeocystis_antarctica.AAC.4
MYGEVLYGKVLSSSRVVIFFSISGAWNPATAAAHAPLYSPRPPDAGAAYDRRPCMRGDARGSRRKKRGARMAEPQKVGGYPKHDEGSFPLLVIFDDSLHNRWSVPPEGLQPEFDDAMDVGRLRGGHRVPCGKSIRATFKQSAQMLMLRASEPMTVSNATAPLLLSLAFTLAASSGRPCDPKPMRGRCDSTACVSLRLQGTRFADTLFVPLCGNRQGPALSAGEKQIPFNPNPTLTLALTLSFSPGPSRREAAPLAADGAAARALRPPRATRRARCRAGRGAAARATARRAPRRGVALRRAAAARRRLTAVVRPERHQRGAGRLAAGRGAARRGERGQVEQEPALLRVHELRAGAQQGQGQQGQGEAAALPHGRRPPARPLDADVRPSAHPEARSLRVQASAARDAGLVRLLTD